MPTRSRFMNQNWKSNPWTSLLGPWLCLLLMLMVLAFTFWFYLKQSFMSFDSHRCSRLLLLLSILILANALSLYCDESFTSFDPNWIQSVGGFFAGILLVLLVLAVVLSFEV
ncbi:hypothetical protein V6N13_120710 [Hibiscus sabdariffa]|uniref:Transmembrane protein n=1 Tax=Hibiscus sabdariffa TaxID=183260 RepID=A0ABR2E545_9ROSI